jgi:DNA polymerase III subunit delta'
LSGSYRDNFFKAIPGQRSAKELIFKAIENGRLASAYLMRGPAGTGKFASALELVRVMKCESPETCKGECKACGLIHNLDHPDLQVIIPLPREIGESLEATSQELRLAVGNPFAKLSYEKPTNIPIDTIREVAGKLSLSPTTDGGRWVIIRDADIMNAEASNAFLKPLEEPPESAHIILTSSRPDFLLPTIRSRTQPIRFVRLSRSEIENFLLEKGVEKNSAKDIALFSDGNLHTALEEIEGKNKDIRALGEELWVSLFSKSDPLALDTADKLGDNRSHAIAILESAISFLRDQILAQNGVGSFIRNVASKTRIETAAQKFPDSKRTGMALRFLQDRSIVLRFNPQYDLFWMDLILRGRNILREGGVE